MKILLTGANGFTGRHFTDFAISKMHQVFPLLADLKDREAVQRGVMATEPDAVIHLAAISSVAHKDENEFYSVNVIGTMNLLAALVNLPVAPKRVLLASSANVYGNCETSPISEKQPPAPVNHYAMSKLSMEYMSQTYINQLPIIIARPFNYTGIGQSTEFIIPKIIEHFSNKRESINLGNINTLREYNDVRMICSSYLELIKSGITNEIYNICTGKIFSLNEILTELTKMTKHKVKIVQDPMLIRQNELIRLSGNPEKLNKLMNLAGSREQAKPLKNILAEMLDHK